MKTVSSQMNNLNHSREKKNEEEVDSFTKNSCSGIADEVDDSCRNHYRTQRLNINDM